MPGIFHFLQVYIIISLKKRKLGGCVWGTKGGTGIIAVETCFGV